ncbi:MAG: histidine kinase [Acidobacteriales bacterium]|nr:histidine kinase [Terriglobales bacterium]
MFLALTPLLLFRRRITLLAIIFASWTLLATLWATHVYMYAHSIGRMVSFRSLLHDALLDYWIWACLTPFVLFLAKTFAFRRSDLISRIVLHLAFCVAFCWIHVTAAHFLHLSPHGKDGLIDDLTTRFASNFYSDLWMYWPLVLIWNLIDFQRRYGERDRHAAMLETQLSEQRLQALRNQLQPHFLFNTLNSVASLMHSDVAAADDMVVDLSTLLRYSLREGNAQEIPLRDELELLDCYLRIQRHRFRDRLKTSVTVPTDLLDAAVPSLLLQPLAENAIEHGLKDMEDMGTLSIEVFLIDDTLNLRIEDNGVGFHYGSQSSERIGIGNARARLRGLYGDRQSFTTANRPEGGAVVLIRLPYRQLPTQAPGPDSGRRTARPQSPEISARAGQ